MKQKPQMTEEEWREKMLEYVQIIAKALTERKTLNLADIGLINTRDLCLMLCVSSKTVAHWRNTGELRCTKKGMRYYYLLSDVKQMMYEGFDRK